MAVDCGLWLAMASKMGSFGRVRVEAILMCVVLYLPKRREGWVDKAQGCGPGVVFVLVAPGPALIKQRLKECEAEIDLSS